MEEENKIPKGAVKYKFLKQRHPEYCAEYWAKCRAFYRGGQCLLGNASLLSEVFPKHRNETQSIYELRKSMSFYMNYAGEIIDELIAKLNSDPLRLEAKKPNPFYTKFLNNCAPAGAEPKRYGDLVMDLLNTAMQCKTAWVLVDMPPADRDVTSLAEQENLGMLDAWAVEIQPESVVDWEVDEHGVLEWALVCYKSNKRKGIGGDRKIITEKYTYYTRRTWTKWEISYPEGTPPKDEKIIQMSGMGEHKFKEVPLKRLSLTDGLWAMGKLESLAKEHFNKRNALSWAEFKALLPVLYEFHDNSPEVMAFGGEGGDIDRGFNQPRSVGHVQIRNANDSVMWVAPPDGPFAHSLASCDSVRDEMHRVVHQMARSASNNSISSRQSGEAKAMNENPTNIVLEAFGDLLREFAINLLGLVQAGRGDGKIEWLATGLSNFQSRTLRALLEQEAILDTSVEIPSPLFKTMRKFQIAKKILGDAAREEELESVQTEIESFYKAQAANQQKGYDPTTPKHEEPAKQVAPGVTRRPANKSKSVKVPRKTRGSQTEPVRDKPKKGR